MKRAGCPVCGKRVRLRKDGKVGAHGDVVEAEGVGEFIVHCAGTGQQPALAAARADAPQDEGPS